MNNIFDPHIRIELSKRISQIQPNSQAEWGKMNSFQMLRHCTENERMLLREKRFRRLFIGRLFGKLALKSNLKDESPLGKNSPTHPDLVIKEQGDVEKEKIRWMNLLEQYATKSRDSYEGFIHPFFGKMNHDQVGKFAYKHIDHHLRQFGV
ncbi:MAG: DUF1569 domain-containing protein [Bacteroidota bacterium]